MLSEHLVVYMYCLSLVQVPFSTEQPQQKKIALYKTRSIGDQVFREVNIEEAIAVSQTESSSQGDRWRVHVGVGVRSQSIDISSQSLDINKKKSKRLFGRKVHCMYVPYY